MTDRRPLSRRTDTGAGKVEPARRRTADRGDPDDQPDLDARERAQTGRRKAPGPRRRRRRGAGGPDRPRADEQARAAEGSGPPLTAPTEPD